MYRNRQFKCGEPLMRHDDVRSICAKDEFHRNRKYVDNAKLDIATIERLFAFQQPQFDSRLLSCGRVYEKRNVVLKQREGSWKPRLVFLELPRFSWHYDLDIRTNIAMLIRSSGPIVPHLEEMNYIALNLVRFNANPFWEYFDTIVESLTLWHHCNRKVCLLFCYVLFRIFAKTFF